MRLKKRIDDKTVVSADYLENGICLRISRKGDKHATSVVTIEIVDGQPCLTTFKNTIRHYGLTERRETIKIKEW